MIRGLNLILMVTSLVALIAVYALKYHTVDTANQKLALEHTVEKQKSDLSLLKADWAYINQPGYIEPIVRRHQAALGLDVIAQEQFVDIASIPMRQAAPDSDALTELLESLEAGVDPIAVLIEANAQ